MQLLQVSSTRLSARQPRSIFTNTLTGLRVLLLEARDRIGGRSWSSDIGGYPFEMGGTWVNWGQAHVWREISRYSMRKELEISQDYSHGVNHHSLFTAEGAKSNLSHEYEVCLLPGLTSTLV
jgi:phytoene dehydrogenase-like protein